MRIIIYSVYNRDTEKLTCVGWNRAKAYEKMQEMQAENPQANLTVVYKWRSY